MHELPDQLRGCQVFPCSPGEKTPATANGWHEASSEPAQIEAWLRINPDFNWACATGLSGLFVVDVDPNGLDWWAKLLERDIEIALAVEKAFQVRTPRGGLHVYFRGEGPSTASRIADGIDTRGGIKRDGKIVSGGYVLLPGSRTSDGAYQALPGGIIAPLPPVIAALVPARQKTDTLGLAKNPDHDQPRNIAWAIDLLKGHVETGKVAAPGSSDNTTFQVAASILDKAISPGMCFDLMWEHWVPHAKLAIDDWWLEQKIINATKHGEDTRSGAKGFQANADAFAAFEGQHYDEPTKRKRFEPMWLRDARRDVRPAKWLIPGFLPDTGTGILYGLSGTYKTFVALDWALCLAHGVAGQWGAPPVKNCVLFLAGESSYALQQERVDSWCAEHGVEPDNAEFIIVRGVPAYGDDEGWAEIRDGLLALGVRPALIVIDTLTRMMTGLSENSNDDAKLPLKMCEEMADHYGAFVLSVGHTGKDQGRGLRGAQAFIDNSDAVFYLAKRGENGINLRVKKLKEVDIPPEPFYLEVKKLGPSIVLERKEDAPLEASKEGGTSVYSWASVEEVIAMLHTQGGSTSLAVLVQEISGKFDVDKKKVQKQLMKNDALKFLRDGDRWRIPSQEFDL